MPNNTDLFCFSAIASRSASGSFARITVAPSLSASAKDSVYIHKHIQITVHLALHVKNKKSHFSKWVCACVFYQDSLSLLRVGVFDSGELRVRIFLLFHSIWRMKVKCLKSSLDKNMAHSMN